MRLSILSSERETFREKRRQSGVNNFLLRNLQVVFHPALFDVLVVEIVNAIRRAPVAVARLADAADVDEIFFCELDAQLIDTNAAHAGVVLNECHRHMGVTEKTNRGVLVSETRGGVEIVEDVTPLRRRIERGVDDGEVAHL